MKTTRKLRIALECRVDDPRAGVGSAILALAHALSQSTDRNQEYTFIVNETTKEWLEPHVFGPCRLVAIAKPQPSVAKRLASRIAPLRTLWQKLKANSLPIPQSDGYVESEGFDLVHFVSQIGYITPLPTIYQPWDLQHIHYPQFFSQNDYKLRERWYRAFCEQATTICMQTEWSRQDVIKQYGIAPEKVTVIRWGSVFSSYEAPSPERIKTAINKYNLPHQFFFYPAITWPHKNHEVIIRAIQLLKQKYSRTVEVYFTGASTEFRTELEWLARELGTSNQLHFLGFVSSDELQVIFGAATAMIFPSKFEGFGLPVLEAFHAGLPVISSNASVLPEVAQDGALYFDPDDPAELAELMNRMLDNPHLKENLVQNGTAVLKRSSIEDTSAGFQILYERIAAINHHDSVSKQNVGNSHEAR